MKLGKQQQDAFEAIMKWYKGKNTEQVFTLGGYAGTGKTTMAKHIAAEIGDDEEKVVFCSFTGKAALNMREKGMYGASTLHSLLYKLAEGSWPPKWVFNPKSYMEKASLVIVDEYSMLNNEILADLLRSTEAKVLALGDPAQLPPVNGVSPLKPDMMLTEVHRQALESPVLRAATHIREEGRLPTYGTDLNDQGCFALVNGNQTPESLHKKFNQILVATNETRSRLNAEISKAIFRNEKGIVPAFGEKIICLQNNYELDIYNGQVGTLRSAKKVRDNKLRGAKIIFGDREIKADIIFKRDMSQKKDKEQMRYTDFDYGYAITCHKSQGSEWNNVGVYPGRWQSKEWLYTAVTRARRNCVVFI